MALEDTALWDRGAEELKAFGFERVEGLVIPELG